MVLRALRVGDDWWLDTDADFAPRLAASLRRFRIRVQAEIDDRTAATGLLSVVGVDVEAPAGLRALPTRWGAVTGTDLVGDRAAVDAALAGLPADLARWSAERFEAFRIEAGVPRQGVDVDDTTIPQEASLERDAVSFTKGCFLGQELVCRIDTRGHVNRHLRRLRITGPVVPPAGAAVVVDGRERGVVTSAAAVPDEGRVRRPRDGPPRGRAARRGAAALGRTRDARRSGRPVSTALFVFGYPTSIAVLTRWLPVVRQRRTAWFVAHELAVAAIVAGWTLRRDPMAVAINATWLAVGTTWYVAAGRRAAAR